MALIAVLEFGDNNIGRYSQRYLLTECKFMFDRSYNEFRPEGAARCQRVEVVLPAPGKQDLNLFEWYSSQGVQNGRIVITLSGGDSNQEDSETQILSFEDATCFSLSENYDISSSHRRMLKLGIMADMISIDSVVFKHR